MTKLVLDTNCIIDLEENRPDALALKTLMAAWRSKQLDLAVVAVSASENQPSGTTNPSYSDFQRKLHNAGLAGAHELLPLAMWDVFYWEYALWTSSEMAALESKVRAVLFPGVVTAPPADAQANSRWRNQMCDVLMAWSCIHHNWPCLVTRDRNFHDHRTDLAALGLTDVLYPSEAVQRYVP